MTDDTRHIRRTTDETQPATDGERPTTGGVQSPTATIDPTDGSGLGLPLDRRHVIAGTLAALGLGAMGSGQARHTSDHQERGYGEADIEVKTGTISHDSPGAAEDGTWNTFEVDQQSVEFEEAFDGPPVVFIGSTSYTSIGLFRAIDVTETGFESRWMVYRSTSFAAPDAQWVAVGQS